MVLPRGIVLTFCLLNYDSEEKSDTSIQYVLLNCYIFGTFQKDVKREREKINLYSNKLKKKCGLGFGMATMFICKIYTKYYSIGKYINLYLFNKCVFHFCLYNFLRIVACIKLLRIVAKNCMHLTNS